MSEIVSGSRDGMKFRENPEKICINAEGLELLLPYWERDVRRKTSAESARNYLYNVAPFFFWWSNSGSDYEFELSEEAILDFHSWLRNDFVNARGQKPSHNGVANILSRTRACFRWCFQSGRSDLDISHWVPTLAQRPKRSRLRHVDGLCRLFEGARVGQNPVRDMAIIAMFAGTGARNIEIFNARMDSGFFELHADKSGWLYFEKAKNDRPRVSVFGPNTGKMLEAWINFSGRESGPFWLGELNDRKMLSEVVLRCASRAGLGTVRSHDIRKLFCSHWFRQYDPNDSRAEYFLGAQVGHTPKGVTQRNYVDIDVSDLLPFYVSPFEVPEFDRLVCLVLD